MSNKSLPTCLTRCISCIRQVSKIFSLYVMYTWMHIITQQIY